MLLPGFKVGMAGSAGRGSGSQVLRTLQAHYDFAGLDLNFLLGVDDQGKQSVCQFGLVPEEGFVQGLLVVVPFDRSVVGGVPPLAQVLSKHQHLEEQTARLRGLEEVQEVGAHLRWAWETPGELLPGRNAHLCLPIISALSRTQVRGSLS